MSQANAGPNEYYMLLSNLAETSFLSVLIPRV